MSDIEILRSGELMVSQVAGASDAGVEFVDAYLPRRKGAECAVVDSGRIILADQDIPELIAECERIGLTVETAEGI